MKILYTILAILFALVAYNIARADIPNLLVGTDFGRYYRITKSTPGEPADLFLISIEAPKIRYFGFHSGIHLGSWNRTNPSNSAKFLGIDSIYKAPMANNWFSKFTFGMSHLLHNTDRLGTKSQFHVAASIGRNLHRANVYCGIQHWSNGSTLFRVLSRKLKQPTLNYSNRPNKAEDFLSCGWRTTF